MIETKKVNFALRRSAPPVINYRRSFLLEATQLRSLRQQLRARRMRSIMYTLPQIYPPIIRGEPTPIGCDVLLVLQLLVVAPRCAIVAVVRHLGTAAGAVAALRTIRAAIVVVVGAVVVVGRPQHSRDLSRLCR